MLRTSVLLIFGLLSISAAFHLQTTTFDGIPSNNNFDQSPFLKIGDKYYLIEATEKLNWFAAAHKCRAKGANLAAIESEDQMKALNAHLVASGHLDLWYWLSGNDLGEENHFQWLSTGQPFGYTKWLGGQPDNAGVGEDCVHLWHVVDNFAMNDVNCDRALNYICEADAPKTVSLTIW